MGRSLTPLLATVGGHNLSVVDWEPFVRVDSHTEESGVGLGQSKMGQVKLFG